MLKKYDDELKVITVELLMSGSKAKQIKEEYGLNSKHPKS